MAKLNFEELLARANAREPMPAKRHPEEDLQRACLRWYDLQWGARKYNGVELKTALHHSPNGGKRNKREAAAFRAMGTRPGFPDLWLGVPVNGCPYLCIELKTTARGSTQSEHQKNYERLVTAFGARYVIVRTLEEFMDTVNGYLAPLFE